MAALVLVVGMLGTLTMVNGANKRISENRGREAATNLARELVEGARALSYPDIAPDTVGPYLQQQPGLADASTAAGWNVVRRGITFTISVKSCIMDDDNPQDGIGDHTDAGEFCADSPTTLTPTDLNPDDYKRVSIKISYTRRTKTYDVRQTAIINNPGSAFAPTVRSLVLTNPLLGAPYTIKDQSVTSADFKATVTPRAKYVRWSVDNVKQGNATGPAIDDWTFRWTFGASLPDGAYLISAQGFNNLDQGGAEKTISIRLNRYYPALPGAFAAGRNNGVGLEFDWAAAPDRDITAYRVYRTASVTAGPSASDAVMCTVTVTTASITSCIANDVSGDQRYYVVAVAPSHTGTGTEESVRPGISGTVLVTANTPPNEPTGLTATRTDGTVVLNWAAPPAPAGGEAGDSVYFYRVYRDGKNIADRYGRADTASLSFVDRDPGAAIHRYYVTAVDTHLGESGFNAKVDG